MLRDGNLIVLEVIEMDADGAESSPAAVHWVGMEFNDKGVSFDAVRLIAEDVYLNCGRYMVGTSVAAVVEIERPFRARLRIRPPTIDNIDPEYEPLVWDRGEPADSAPQCVRAGELTWKAGRFAGSMDTRACAADEQPVRIRIEQLMRGR